MNAPDRRHYIGGGSIAAVVNLDPRRTALDLWFSMTSDEPPPPLDPKLARFFKRRARQEPVVIEMLKDEGIEVTRMSWGNPNRYQDQEYAWMAAEIDFEFAMNQAARERFPDVPGWADIPDGTILNGEIKTANVLTSWKFGEEGTDEMPIEHTTQVMWGLGITGRRACLGAVLVGVDDLILFPIMRSEDDIAWLRREAIKFWGLVQTRVPPEPKNVDDILNLYRRYSGKPVELDEPTLDTVSTIFRLRDAIKVAEQGKEEAEFRLFDFVRRAWGVPADPTAELPGDNAMLTYGGQPIAVWRRQNGSNLDQKRLATERPEIVKEYTRRTTFRVLAKPPKGKKRRQA